MSKFGSKVGDVVGWVEANPAIIQLGSDAITAAVNYVQAAWAAHQAGVLTDQQIQDAWALVTADVSRDDAKLTADIAAWRARHPAS